MSNKLSFQEIILRLLDFWKEQGCLIQQPYNVQVGAGTMNPATSLRVLGPEPWNVAYIEPSIRPDDGRFGDNPNRMQMHHQLQVILKPDPGNPQELYLKSLEAIGINPREHDIRFVEDNWESPALGAWGLGWEVWLDGQEITQFTYFQQAGGAPLDPVSVEITYGLDRIALALQGTKSVWEMEYGAGISYENVLLQSEIEHCQYYFNVADVEAIKQVYDIYEREAQRCIEAGLVIPAHDYNLKCSHLFNILDTRGAVGVTERAQFFRRMRGIARQVSDLYLAQRERLEYPFLPADWSEERVALQRPLAGADAAQEFHVPQTFLLEIGSEELPVGDLNSAIRQLRVLVPELLDELRLTYERVEVEGTPRRLVITVIQCAPRQPDQETVVKGPPADRAFDAEGKPTQAAYGFAKGKGVNLSDLHIEEEGGKRYVTAVIREQGRPAIPVLAEALPGLIAAIKFEKSMRWNSTNISYSRPLRWLVALYGPEVVPFSYAGVESSRVSRGLRPYGSPEIEIDSAVNFGGLLRKQGINLNPDKRKEQIVLVASKLAAEKGGAIPDDPDLLDEVANLVERPTPLRGTFSDRFLKLPAEVLVAVMKKHQRYFPVYNEHGRLMPYFIGVRNGDEKHLDLVVEGNEHVIVARFADAEFFYGQDSKHKLADFLPKLGTLTFQAELGSMLDKSRRLEQLAPAIAGMLGLDEEETAVATRAAALAKADLATNMVVEMTSLQGIMGGHYAQLSGEPEAVCQAIAEQYQAVSQTRPGLALALADRLDSLAGLFAAGLAPKGSNDPFALRRAALHIIENLTANQISFDVRAGMRAAAQFLPIPQSDAGLDEVMGFVYGRLEGVLREQGFAASVVKAVLAAQGDNPYLAGQTAVALSAAIRQEDWHLLLDAYARCVRITRSYAEPFPLRPADFALPAEKNLLAAYQSAAAHNSDLPTFVENLRQMQPAISAFFEEVLVMDENTAVRDNRLALLQHIAGLAAGLADLSQLEGF
ncbi:MAG: glycine--tRNA ligase subunit beta [Chloroflexi bacterium]|nr:glycine--tRNA ligase subunit beta [Ardenticatenaceae bacterium]MBL1128406.1 glycine--tRNA ligase subunit beta [Chloroflexota bacterium]NOG34483.1 glycine--tRNA ligase subunit beta [Chloroflexota bacterium]GIK59011.1 MAG: glycine--tRNA ligase [Chloroflexota bacterium]